MSSNSRQGLRNRFLIVGKAWVDAGSYAVVRLEGQYAASMSILVGAPHIREEFIEVRGFWLPGHVHSVTSSFLAGPDRAGHPFYQLPARSGFGVATVIFRSEQNKTVLVLDFLYI
jgi:hypothetical protein